MLLPEGRLKVLDGECLLGRYLVRVTENLCVQQKINVPAV